MAKFKTEIDNLLRIIKNLDKKTLTVLIVVPFLLTISWYFTSRLFFQQNLSGYFNGNDNAKLYEFAYWFVGDFLVLFVIPWLIIKKFFKEKLNDYGIAVGDFKIGIKLALIFIIIMLPFIWFATSRENFILTYPMLVTARNSWSVFIIFEAGILVYIFVWEFILRGFMLFGLKSKFGYYAVLIQMIPFVLMHFGKPSLETFGAIFGGLALGILAYRTKSIYYCIVAHAGIMFSIDFISVLRYRTGVYGTGLSSLLHIVKHII